MASSEILPLLRTQPARLADLLDRVLTELPSKGTFSIYETKGGMFGDMLTLCKRNGSSGTEKEPDCWCLVFQKKFHNNFQTNSLGSWRTLGGRLVHGDSFQRDGRLTAPDNLDGDRLELESRIMSGNERCLRAGRGNVHGKSIWKRKPKYKHLYANAMGF